MAIIVISSTVIRFFRVFFPLALNSVVKNVCSVVKYVIQLLKYLIVSANEMFIM